MSNFEALENIDNFCKVIVKKTPTSEPETNTQETEEPLIDVFDEEDYVRILVQCRCREQQVTFHPVSDGITICREECRREKNGAEICNDVCSKLNLRTDELQLGDMQFVIAKCNNNNTLEAMIPKMKK